MDTFKVILLVVAGLIGIGAFDAALRLLMPLRTPDFVFVEGDNPRTTYVVFDGLAGDPELRFDQLNDVFGGNNVLYVNPKGNRYNLERVVAQTMVWLNRNYEDHVTPVGLSLGAKVAYRLTQRLQYSLVGTDRLVLIDPLYSGVGVVSRLAKIVRWWYPGPIQNFLFGWLLAWLLVGKPKNAHQRYSATVKPSRFADEVRASMAGAISGGLKRHLPVVIVHVHPAEDNVLVGQFAQWYATFRVSASNDDVQRVCIPQGTRHLGLDTEPEIWRKDLARVLS